MKLFPHRILEIPASPSHFGQDFLEGFPCAPAGDCLETGIAHFLHIPDSSVDDGADTTKCPVNIAVVGFASLSWISVPYRIRENTRYFAVMDVAPVQSAGGGLAILDLERSRYIALERSPGSSSWTFWNSRAASSKLRS